MLQNPRERASLRPSGPPLSFHRLPFFLASFWFYPQNFPTKSDLVIEKPWLNEVSAATLQQKQRDFIEFSRQYFNNNRKEKLGRPNYKNKHDNQSFRLPFPKFKITDNKIRIEKIGWVKIVIDREIPDNARFISCTVSKNRSGQYFVSVKYVFSKMSCLQG